LWRWPALRKWHQFVDLLPVSFYSARRLSNAIAQKNIVVEQSKIALHHPIFRFVFKNKIKCNQNHSVVLLFGNQADRNALGVQLRLTELYIRTSCYLV